MNEQIIHFESRKRFRYLFKEGTSDVAKKKLLIALHGYGQLIPYFSRKFLGLENYTSLLFPEGMHRFYLDGTSGRVGASWMTKEDRLIDIEDNIRWLNELLNEIKLTHGIENVSLLGFSQGGATAARWYHQNNLQFDKFIMWASIFPPDIEISKEIVENSFFILGSEDHYFEKDKEIILSFYRLLNYQIVHFTGGHDIHLPTLTSLYND